MTDDPVYTLLGLKVLVAKANQALKCRSAPKKFKEDSEFLDISKIDIQGVYFLLVDDVVMYVGATSNCNKRIGDHVAKGWIFDKMRVVVFEDMREAAVYEQEMIIKYQPPWNGKQTSVYRGANRSQGGKLWEDVA